MRFGQSLFKIPAGGDIEPENKHQPTTDIIETIPLQEELVISN